MLRLSGYIHILIVLGHIGGLNWAEQLFEVSGIGKEITNAPQSIK